MAGKKYFIVGRVCGSYRTQNLIKYLLDQEEQVFYNSFQTNLFLNEKKGLKKIIRLFFRGIEEVIRKTTNLYYLFNSDIVILPAMCNDYQFELRLAYIFNKKIIADYYFSFYDTFVLDRKDVKMESFNAKRYMRFDSNYVNKSNFTMFLNKVEAKYYLNLLNIEFNPEKHKIVPLCVEEQIKGQLNYFSNSKNNGVFNICWWGTYIPLHGLEKIIEACKILKERNEVEFHCYLFGTDNKKSLKYLKMINDLGLSSVVTINNECTFKNGKLSQFLENNCDLVLGNFGDSKKAKNVLVNKLIDGVAMKIPVLTGESKAPKEFFSDKDIFYSENNPVKIADKMYQISQKNTDDILSMVESSYLIFNKVFSVEAYRKNINKLFEE